MIMTKLAELIARDNIEAHWFWTHEVSTGPHSEYEVWDLVLVRDTHEPQKWVTDGDTRRTAYFREIGGAQADSRRATGGARREPDLQETLSELLADAADVDAHPTFREWDEYHSDDMSLAHAKVRMYERLTYVRDTLRAWLGDEYDEYQSSWS